MTALGELGRRRRITSELTRPFHNIDSVLVGAIVALSLLGVLMVYSATRGAEPPFTSSYLVRQALFVAGGLVAMGVVALFDYRRLLNWAWVPYGVVMVALVAVLSPLGTTVNGAQRWFSVGPFTAQPSEFIKLALIIAIAAMLAGWQEDIGPGRILKVLAVVAAPSVLVMAQPDLGTVLQYLAMGLGMLLLGGVRARYLIVMVLLGVGLSVAVLTSDSLADYQRDRLTSFIDPGIDAQGITYNQNQSVTAVASGGFAGQGLFDGPQTQLRFVPEQETDFIFTVVAEELGFVGGALVLGLFGVVCWRLWRIARSCRDNFGYLLTGGVLIMLLFQLFSNVGMAIGIMPITGTALPFISYGGSSILTTLVSLGLALSVGMRRFD